MKNYQYIIYIYIIHTTLEYVSEMYAKHFA